MDTSTSAKIHVGCAHGLACNSHPVHDQFNPRCPKKVDMKTYNEEETNLLIEELGRVEDPEARAAFFYLVTDAKMRRNYVVGPGGHGFVKNFRYYHNGKWFYSFIPNKNSLLWYFRRPLLNEYAVDTLSLKNSFDDVKVTGSNEITVRLNNFQDAARIVTYLI